jgi:hypothetical protein
MIYTLAGSEAVEPLAALWQETTQAHFLNALTVPEALVVLRERRERIHHLLPLAGRQQRHSCSALLIDHFQLVLAAELAWIERAIAALQGSDSCLDKEVGGVESRGS